jgi:RNA 2',3'-cyclic 3'-phosphodiesterase
MADLAAPPSGIRLFDPSDVHLTIAFFGAVGHERALQGWHALDWPLGAVEIELGEIVPMGNPKRYSALSFSLRQGGEAIEAAIGGVRGVVLAAAGAPAEHRAPKAHITVARPARSASGETRSAGIAWARSVNLAGTKLVLATPALYGWSLDRQRSLFRIIAGG